MTRHSFDPLCAAAGLLFTGLGILVILGESIRTSPWWLVAVAVLVLGVGMVPWRRDSVDRGPEV